LEEVTAKVAFYGKGGIGKSTVSSNVAACAAREGKRVLFIGCDPKADSTRNLVGRRIPTVLSQVRQRQRDGKRLEYGDLVFTGYRGVQCVEAGGPMAGRGCAGLGIGTAIRELDRLRVFLRDWDLVVYDVLGDVVCGGFSLPMKKNRIDRVYVVTSAERMSLYAANVVLQGVANYSSPKKPILGGLVQNHLSDARDRDLLDVFAEKTRASIAARIPQSQAIRGADDTVSVLTTDNSDGDILAITAIEELTRTIVSNPPASMPFPMSEDDWDVFWEENRKITQR